MIVTPQGLTQAGVSASIRPQINAVAVTLLMPLAAVRYNVWGAWLFLTIECFAEPCSSGTSDSAFG